MSDGVTFNLPEIQQLQAQIPGASKKDLEVMKKKLLDYQDAFQNFEKLGIQSEKIKDVIKFALDAVDVVMKTAT
ncbi:MAG: hypothetical protein PHH73_04805 [Candidatus Rickettsiella isopodorum]|nr:hypothetical protein [Candidatus Rickettsiella isopodorum]